MEKITLRIKRKPVSETALQGTGAAISSVLLPNKEVKK